MPLPTGGTPMAGTYPPPPYPSTAPPAAFPPVKEAAGFNPVASPAADMSPNELAELRAQLEKERFKNDMRQEMDMKARLAAAEAAGRGGGQAMATNVVVNAGTGRHFGLISLLLCPFVTCVMCCPVDPN